jgi:hypothetical protein
MVTKAMKRAVSTTDMFFLIAICRASGWFDRNCCGGIIYKFCARVEMMSSVVQGNRVNEYVTNG